MAGKQKIIWIDGETTGLDSLQNDLLTFYYAMKKACGTIAEQIKSGLSKNRIGMSY